MKFRTPEKRGKKQVSAKEMLSITEAEDHPMPDFEQLFTPQERQSLESKFVAALEELEGGNPNKREFIEGELSGFLVLDQVLTSPLVAEDMRRRAKEICQRAIHEYVDQLVATVLDEPLNGNFIELLSITSLVFPEFVARTKLPTKVVEEILQRLMGPERPTEWDEARILFNLLILNPEQQAIIKKFAWSHGLDDIWQNERVAQDRLLPKALHRLLEPSKSLTPLARQKWLANYKLDPDLYEILSLSIRGYAVLAILMAPEPQVTPDGRIDLGMPKKKMAEPTALPVRPHV